MHVSWKWSHQITAFFFANGKPMEFADWRYFLKNFRMIFHLPIDLILHLYTRCGASFVCFPWCLCRGRGFCGCTLRVSWPVLCDAKKRIKRRWKQFHLHPHRSPHLSRRKRGPVCRLIPFFWAASWCFNPFSSKWMTELWLYILLEYCIHLGNRTRTPSTNTWISKWIDEQINVYVTQVVPGRAGAEVSEGKKNCIAKK